MTQLLETLLAGVDSASNRNEYQEYEYFLEYKGGRFLGLTD